MPKKEKKVKKKKVKSIKQKVRILDSKIKEVSSEEQESDLEEDIEQSEVSQFKEFVSTGRPVSPLIETGQEAPQQTQTLPRERTPAPAPEENAGVQYASASRTYSSSGGTQDPSASYRPNAPTLDPAGKRQPQRDRVIPQTLTETPTPIIQRERTRGPTRPDQTFVRQQEDSPLAPNQEQRYRSQDKTVKTVRKRRELF